VMNADGTDPRRVTRDKKLDLAPEWLPDARIAFISCAPAEDEPPDCELVAISLDSGRRERLAELGFTFEADVSSDGTKVVYSQLEGQSHFQHFEVHVADIDGDSDRQLTDNDTGDGSPTWSPDGERIVFVTNRGESARCFSHDCGGFTTELYAMDADGGEVVRLTETPHEESAPTWSPDGSKIVYSRQLDAEDPRELYIMNADGTCPARLLPGRWDTMPDWYGPAGARSRPLEC
jgi:Tol biopolymer transport system component